METIKYKGKEYLEKILNCLGLYTKRQMNNAFEAGRQEEMHKMYVIDTNNIVLKHHPERWLEKAIGGLQDAPPKWKATN